MVLRLLLLLSLAASVHYAVAANGDSGYGIDPNGGSNIGAGIDPNGTTLSNGDGGPGMDPNG